MKRFVKVNSEIRGGYWEKILSKRGLSSRDNSLNSGNSGMWNHKFSIKDGTPFMNLNRRASPYFLKRIWVRPFAGKELMFLAESVFQDHAIDDLSTKDTPPPEKILC